MKQPLEIRARDVRLSDDTESLIREKVAKLDKYYDRIIGCRVAVEMPHKSQRRGRTFNVRIDLTVPRGTIVITREPDEDLHAAIIASFDIALRQVKEYSEKQRGEVKIHIEKPLARVTRLFPEEGYGFLQTPEGREVYFHENAVLEGKFEELQIGTAVTFVEHAGDKGAQASSVAIA